MPYGNTLHADDTHAECVSRLGKLHADAVLSGAECSHCECFSLASQRSRLAFFSESDSAPRALATWAEAKQAIPGVSPWVMTTVRRGYTLQFARRPPRFRGVFATIMRSEDSQYLRAEVMNLLEKGAIEIVPPAQSESGFYSRSFLVPKKTAACDLF